MLVTASPFLHASKNEDFVAAQTAAASCPCFICGDEQAQMKMTMIHDIILTLKPHMKDKLLQHDTFNDYINFCTTTRR
jgi:hypothetical protein